jgi:hypothetical protein
MTALFRFLGKSFLVLMMVTVLVACNRITQDNFDKIQPGMSMSQVISILGEPTDLQSINFSGLSGTSATWKNHDASIVIQFLNDTVQIKSFVKSSDQPRAASPNMLPMN